MKPSNILINRAGEIKLCDFGIAGELVNSFVQTDIGCKPYLAVGGALSYMCPGMHPYLTCARVCVSYLTCALVCVDDTPILRATGYVCPILRVPGCVLLHPYLTCARVRVDAPLSYACLGVLMHPYLTCAQVCVVLTRYVIFHDAAGTDQPDDHWWQI